MITKKQFAIKNTRHLPINIRQVVVPMFTADIQPIGQRAKAEYKTLQYLWKFADRVS